MLRRVNYLLSSPFALEYIVNQSFYGLVTEQDTLPPLPTANPRVIGSISIPLGHPSIGTDVRAWISQAPSDVVQADSSDPTAGAFFISIRASVDGGGIVELASTRTGHDGVAVAIPTPVTEAGVILYIAVGSLEKQLTPDVAGDWPITARVSVDGGIYLSASQPLVRPWVFFTEGPIEDISGTYPTFAISASLVASSQGFNLPPGSNVYCSLETERAEINGSEVSSDFLVPEMDYADPFAFSGEVAANLSGDVDLTYSVRFYGLEYISPIDPGGVNGESYTYDSSWAWTATVTASGV